MVEPLFSLEPGHKLKFVPNIIFFSDPTMTNRISIIHQRAVPLSKSVKMFRCDKDCHWFFGVIDIFFKAENIILIIIVCAEYRPIEYSVCRFLLVFNANSWNRIQIHFLCSYFPYNVTNPIISSITLC